jgi:transposase
MILRDPKKLRVYLKVGHTDMRKSWNGLYGIIKEEMQLDPYGKSLFLFSGHSRKTIKAIYWDGNGFCIWQKKLVRGRFAWPGENSQKVIITQRELSWLLKGIDFRGEHKELIFSDIY